MNSKRPWFQLHLSTYLVLFFMIASMWGLYVIMFESIHKLSVDHGVSLGTILWRNADDVAGLVTLGAAPILMLASVAYICERSIRRQRSREESSEN